MLQNPWWLSAAHVTPELDRSEAPDLSLVWVDAESVLRTLDAGQQRERTSN